MSCTSKKAVYGKMTRRLSRSTRESFCEIEHCTSSPLIRLKQTCLLCWRFGWNCLLFDDVRRTIFVFVLLLGEILVTQRNSASLTTQCPISEATPGWRQKTKRARTYSSTANPVITLLRTIASGIRNPPCCFLAVAAGTLHCSNKHHSPSLRPRCPLESEMCAAT